MGTEKLRIIAEIIEKLGDKGMSALWLYFFGEIGMCLVIGVTIITVVIIITRTIKFILGSYAISSSWFHKWFMPVLGRRSSYPSRDEYMNLAVEIDNIINSKIKEK
jgi:hypothetical protein